MGDTILQEFIHKNGLLKNGVAIFKANVIIKTAKNEFSGNNIEVQVTFNNYEKLLLKSQDIDTSEFPTDFRGINSTFTENSNKELLVSGIHPNSGIGEYTLTITL